MNQFCTIEHTPGWRTRKPCPTYLREQLRDLAREISLLNPARTIA